MGRLEGKVALISGTAGGMGRAAAIEFAAQGALVAGCDMNVEGDAETEALVRDAGGVMKSFAPVDLTDEAQAVGWVEAAVAEFGGVDVLYNNASVARVGPWDELDYVEWRRTITYELDLVYLSTKAAWPHLVARGGGCVINVGSVSAARGAELRAPARARCGQGRRRRLHQAPDGVRDPAQHPRGQHLARDDPHAGDRARDRRTGRPARGADREDSLAPCG